MRNTGFVENPTSAAKTHSFIESDNRNLSVEIDFLGAQRFGRHDRAVEQFRPDTPAPKFL